MNRNLNHDEHQFIASGKLLAAKGLLPYKDYPYFHTPNLTFAYGLLFNFTDNLLMGARGFTAVCAFFSLGLIFFVAYNLFAAYHYLIRFLIAAGSVVLLMLNPVFIYTSSRTWNHSASVMLALAAFVTFCYGINRLKAKQWLFGSGIFLGLAMGTRLSLAPLFAPFIIMIIFLADSTTQKRKAPLITAFCLGVFLANLPSLLLFAAAPKQFWFGNFTYAKLNTIFREAIGYQKTMGLSLKIQYLVDVAFEPGNLLLFAPFILLIAPLNINNVFSRPKENFEFTFILLLLPFLLIGSFAPTPIWYQYFYVLIPFIVLGIFYGAFSIVADSSRPKILKTGLAVIFAMNLLVLSIYELPKYQPINKLFLSHSWLTTQVHQDGMEIKKIVGTGKVLTLAPIFPLEGGLEIYNEFASGPFAWRVSPYMDESKRNLFDIIPPPGLARFLKSDPPKAILTGFERFFENPIIDYARNHGYKGLILKNGKTLYVSPSCDIFLKQD